MKVSQKIILYISGMIVLLSFPACNGILAGIYDEPEFNNVDNFGFIYVNEEKNEGRIYVNASDYTQWNYINLHNNSVITTDVEAEAPENWDFAFHRYDTKTNNGAVFETNAVTFNELPTLGTIPTDSFAIDEWTTDKIIIDMSQMMDGNIKYVEDWYNTTLSRWLNVDKSTMPPIYTLSNKIYIIRLNDGTYAALKIPYYMNDSGVKGYITIDYLYPIEYDK